jgi:mono/diheme cytochrome c family protein
MRATLQTTTKLASSAVLAISFGTLAITATSAEDRSFAQVQRGKALVDAGDCVACHTQAGAQPFTGGRPIKTPFGVIYSPNITPDRETGIGAWSDEDFYRAMHEGIRPDGARLYPAFPYPYFTKMPREDVMAVRAYLNTLQPTPNPRPANKLFWPLNYRVFMRGWNAMFFTPGTFVADNGKDAEWNRGAYLVEGPGHCGACHTPKNLFGSGKSAHALQGGAIQNWFAPNITSDQHHGIGSWTVDEVVEYLKTGRNARSGAAGLMSEVVRDSTSKMSDSDLRAMAVYLKGERANPETPPLPDRSADGAGKAIYADSCSGCHRSDGTGVPHMFPPLAKNANAQSSDPTTIIRVILEGARTAVTDPRPTPSTMPAYDWKLSNDDVAAVATYVRSSWGNAAPKVTTDQVNTLRQNLKATTH